MRTSEIEGDEDDEGSSKDDVKQWWKSSTPEKIAKLKAFAGVDLDAGFVPFGLVAKSDSPEGRSSHRDRSPGTDCKLSRCRGGSESSTCS